MATIKETIPFNYDEIYAKVEQKFVDEGYDVQEGSNTMQLVSAMSYLVSMLNANTAANINETLLTLARKRKMALRDSRVLGYEAAHVQSYQYELELEFGEGTHTISKYDSFTAGDYTYYYMGDTIGPFTVNTGETTIQTIIVKEGTLTLYTDDTDTLSINMEAVTDATTGVTSTEPYIDVAYTNVEEDGIEMFLTYYDEEGTLFNQEVWTRSSQFMIEADTELTREFVRIDNIDYGTPRLYFRIGDIGNTLRTGTLVQMNILQSSGEAGAMTETPATSEFDCTVKSYTLSVKGSAEETIESIKSNAPLFHNSANRAVTKPDYQAFCNRQTAVDSTAIWDGHNEFPNIAGNIWFSFTPSTVTRSIIDETAEVGANYGDGLQFSLQNFYDNDNWYLANDQIVGTGGIFEILDAYKIPTMTLNHRHPVYMDFEYNVRISRYSIKTSESEVNYNVFKIIDDYFTGLNEENAMESFEFEYFQSNLTKRIDQGLTDIMGFDIELNNSIHLSDQNIIEETAGNKEIRIHLGIPYRNVFDDLGDVVFSFLPDITTPAFDGTNTLTVDESSLAVSYYSNVTQHKYNIMLNGGIVGEYRVYSGNVDDIEIILYINSTGYPSGLNNDIFDSSIVDIDGSFGTIMNVAYPYPNIKMSRNTIPRLKTVNFV